MRKKWIGPANPGEGGEDMGHEVVIGGRSLGIVRPGDVIEVPGEIAEAESAPVWPAELWEDVKSSSKKKGED